MWGQDWLHAGCQEVGKCSTRGGLQECTLHLPPQKVNKAEPTLALNPEETSPEIQNSGTSGPKKDMCVCQKLFKKSLILITPAQNTLVFRYSICQI